MASSHRQLQKLQGHLNTSSSEHLGGEAQGHQGASGLLGPAQNIQVLPLEGVRGPPGH